MAETTQSGAHTNDAELEAMLDARHSKKARTGLIVITALAILTALEYWVAVMLPEPLTDFRLLLLTATAVLKAWLIIQFFMHLSQLWHTGEDH